MRGMAREYAAGNSRGPTDVPPAKAAQEGPEGGWCLDCATENTGRPTGTQRIGVVDAVAASQRSSDQAVVVKGYAIRSGLFCGSICWVLLVSGRVLFQNHYPRFRGNPLRFLQGLSPRPSFGGFGLKQLEVTAVS